jgi:hypothetical protein
MQLVKTGASVARVALIIAPRDRSPKIRRLDGSAQWAAAVSSDAMPPGFYGRNGLETQ